MNLYSVQPFPLQSAIPAGFDPFGLGDNYL